MKIVSTAEMRTLEAAAIAGGLSGYDLMGRAGEASAHEILRIAGAFPARHRRRFVVLAGKGNNGGDGWVVARCLHEAGERVVVCSVCKLDLLGDDARLHAQRLAVYCPVHIVPDGVLPPGLLVEGDVIIDALLGIGAKGAPAGAVRELIAAASASGLPVFALDVPSGLDADTGRGEGALHAHWTLAAGLPKAGLFLADGPALCGTLRVVPIGLTPAQEGAVAGGRMEAFARRDALGLAAPRPIDGHKNTFGHTLCLCNSADYTGAGDLCATAALRIGSGLVTLMMPGGVTGRREGLSALIQHRIGDQDAKHFARWMCGIIDSYIQQRATAIVYGPGTSSSADIDVLSSGVRSGRPVVVDADGLRLLAAHPDTLDGASSAVVLTPHPGEMRALLQGFGLGAQQEAPRAEQAEALAERAACTVVLKGRHTLVAMPGGRLSVNTSGDVSLATAGSGDVLAGAIGGLLATGMAPWDAARLGVYLHGLAAELRRTASRSLVADDLPLLLSDAWADLSPLL